jgi:murein DD-endopeptidase MepM/ murein hydrolase activator NlpD
MLVCPIAAPLRVTQHFGQNPKNYQKYGIKAHDGWDATGPKAGLSVPVYAPCDGVLAYTMGIPGYQAYGTGVQIMCPPDKDGRRREVVLGHFASLNVANGQYIHQGEMVGMMGQTGAATGIHIHLGLRFHLPDSSVENYENGYHGWIDPEPFIRYWLDHPAIDPFLKYPNG